MACFDLVFNGGGVKGLAFVGALQALEAAGGTHGRLVGTSAGAITAVFTAAGYAPDELYARCTALDPATGEPVMAGFLDAPVRGDFSAEQIDGSLTAELLEQAHVPQMIAHAILGHMLDLDLYRELFGFNECGGFYAGNKALRWFEDSLEQKGMDPGITWGEFAEKTGRDVSLVTTNTTHAEMVVLNARTAPGCPVAHSMRMSMSIPFVWREVEWNPAWGAYMGKAWPPPPPPVPPAYVSTPIFVDGGVVSNFALGLLAEPGRADVRGWMGEPPPGDGRPVLGLYLDATTVVPGAVGSKDVTRRPRLRAADRVTALVDTMTASHDLAVMEQYAEQVCRIPVGGFGTTEFRMSSPRQLLLIASGKQAMEAYLAGRGSIG